MKKILAKICCSVLALCLICSGLVACGAPSWKAGNLKNGGEILSQNGFVAESENYLYYINGSSATSNDNRFGAPIKGALMAVDKASLKTDSIVTEVVVPKIFSATDVNAGLFFDNGYVYYGTPNTEKTSGGAVAYTEMTFARTKLDGSGSTETFFTVGAHETEYRIVKGQNTVYIVYYDSNEQALISYDTATKTKLVIAKTAQDATELSLANYTFINGENTDQAIVVYTTTVYAEPYNATEAEKSDYSRLTENYNKIFFYKAGDVKADGAEVVGTEVLDGGLNASEFDQATYSFTLVQGDYLFYKSTPVQGTAKLYAVKISDFVATGAQTAVVVKNESYVAKTSIIEELDQVYIIENSVVYCTTLVEADGAIKTPVAKTGSISTLLFIDGAELYYYNASSQLARVTLKNVDGGAGLNDEVNEIRISEDTVSSAWYKPQLMTIDGETYVFYLDNSTLGNSYVKFANVNGEVVEPEEDDATKVYYLNTDNVKLLGIKTNADYANEVTTRIENLSNEILVGGYLEFDDEDADVLAIAKLDEVKALYDGLSSEVKSLVSAQAKTTLDAYVKAVEIANKYNALKGIQEYNTTDHTKEDIPASIKTAYDLVVADLQNFKASADADKIDSMIKANYKFFYQRAREFFAN